jgi:protein import protein ZIM17
MRPTTAHLRLSRFPAPIHNRRAIPIRFAHSIPRPPPRTAPPTNDFSTSSETSTETSTEEGFSEEGSSETSPSKTYAAPPPAPNSYQLSFTCLPCGARSTHNVSKQGYHHGSVLATCPECRNRHVISDHLDIFGDRKITVEELVRERGGIVRKGTLGEDGDIEFWADDGSAEPTN